MARPFEDSDVIVTVLFKYVHVVEDLGLLTFIPLENLCYFSVTHLFYTVIRSVRNWANIVKGFLCIEVMTVSRFEGGQTKSNR
jgi:hypothetical protein